jgi:hypothetical protein
MNPHITRRMFVAGPGAAGAAAALPSFAAPGKAIRFG